MNSKKLQSEYIWTEEVRQETDLKVCFRKKVEAPARIRKLKLSIHADSRYYLWVDGEFKGTGPSRAWPGYPQKDTLIIDPAGFGTRVQIAVLVWHFGTSTSQYINGPAGLALRCEYTDEKNNQGVVVSDEDWKCSIHGGYARPVPRINVSQPFIEMLDSAVFPDNWMNPDFDESGWRRAVTTGPVNESARLEHLPDRDIPLLRSVKRRPAGVLLEQSVRCRGTGIRVDYKQTFYPDDTTTEDRLQTGYICWLVDSPVKQRLEFILADRLWPEADEYLIHNGRRILMPPGSRRAELDLEQGENLFLLDVSGARQRFTADIYLAAEHELTFLRILPDSDALIAALGPFETAVIGNIVCADGFVIDPENPDFLQAGESRNAAELSRYSGLLHPVENVLVDGVKLRGLGALVHPLPLQPEPVSGHYVVKPSNVDGDHEIIIDMGGEVSGFLCFRVESGGAAELDFRFFEYLADGIPEIPDDLDTSLRFSFAGGRGGFRSLLRRGFRFLALRSRAESAVVVSELHVDEQLFPFDERGAFHTGDSRLNGIWDMCRRTVELCSEDAPVDSPAFEQAFWTGDAYVMALYHQYLFGNTELIRHSLMLAARSMDYSELPDCHLPAGVHLLLTAWAQLWILAGRDYWGHTADRDFIRELYPWLKKAADSFFSCIDERGLLNIAAWNMLDWAPMDTPYRGRIAHLNARLSACFRAVSELAGILQLGSDEELWKRRAEELARRTDEAFWDERLQCYIDCIHEDGRRSGVISVQTNLMMMIYGCVPAARRSVTESFILNPPSKAVRPGSPFLAHFYYEYLFSLGRGEDALNGIREQWRPMLETGTCWETFTGFYKDRLTRSYCHAWSSAPAYLFGAWVLGIRPLEPGFEKILIAPVPSGLEYAEGRVPIPSGDVEVSWKIEERELRCDIRIPEGVEWFFKPSEGGWDSSSIRVEEYKPEERV